MSKEKLTPAVKAFIEKHITLLDTDKLEEFYACAREELEAFEIVELMFVIAKSGAIDDNVLNDSI